MSPFGNILHFGRRSESAAIPVVFGTLALALGFVTPAWGAELPADSKSQVSQEAASAPTSVGGKKVIALDAIHRVQIEMPDGTIRDFGKDLEANLVTRFTESGRYLIADEIHPMSEAFSDERSTSSRVSGDFQWSGSVTPSARLAIRIEGLSFQAGSRGERMFYGFNERFQTPFNDGTVERRNEFPLKQVSFEPNWFDRTFDVKGTAPTDSAAGLDLGDGFSLNFLFAWVSLKYAHYQSDLHLKLLIDAPLAGKREEKRIDVSGQGFFYDLAGAYTSYSAAIALARKDAMDQALQNALAASYDVIEKSVAADPLYARIDAITEEGDLLLGTGTGADVPSGALYEARELPGVVVKVVSSNSSGSIGRVVQGRPSDLKPRMILAQVAAMPPPPLVHGSGDGETALPHGPQAVAASAFASTRAVTTPERIQVELPEVDLPASNLGGLAPQVDWAQAWAKALTDMLTLGYRIFRYFSYDQSYHAMPDAASTPNSVWFESAAQSAWGRQIGLDRAFNEEAIRKTSDAARSGSVVAIIDSGVDYNHPLLHPSLWLNPDPVSDSSGKDHYGWDFISNDPRPYDDGYHGTQLASAVLMVAPQALILPLKAFNPFGITSSAALYGSFQYAVDHGAQVILCGWATRKASQALELGVAYAREHGVLVVAAAGDRGDDLEKNPAYPASLASRYDNVLTVTGVDEKDELVRAPGKFANQGPATIRIAAPGQAVRVAEPRSGDTVETSTGIAAALVAGAVARESGAPYADAIASVLESADSVPGLISSVAQGRRLHLPKAP